MSRLVVHTTMYRRLWHSRWSQCLLNYQYLHRFTTTRWLLCGTFYGRHVLATNFSILVGCLPSPTCCSFLINHGRFLRRALSSSKSPSSDAELNCRAQWLLFVPLRETISSFTKASLDPHYEKKISGYGRLAGRRIHAVTCDWTLR